MIPNPFVHTILEARFIQLLIACRALKYKIQDIIDTGDIVLRRKGEQGPNVNDNPFWEHGNTVGVITVDENFDEVDPIEKITENTSQLFVEVIHEDIVRNSQIPNGSWEGQVELDSWLVSL